MTARRVRSVVLATGLVAVFTAQAHAQQPVQNSTSATAAAAPPSIESVFDNLSLFVGPDGSKQPQDLGINANMGLRFSGNFGVPIVKAAHLGLQFGAAYNASDAAVNVLDQISTTSRRTQTFFTVGLFQRTDSRLSWGIAYDGVIEHYFDNFRFSQWRGQVSVGVTKADEIGTWFAKGINGENGSLGGTAVRLDPIGQANIFTRHTWANAARTSVWVGVASGHDDVVWVLPANPRTNHVLVYGAELYMPLSERFAVTGSANLMQPASTGTVDAFLGVAFFPKKGAMRASRNTFAPMMEVGNNPSFSVNLKRY